MPRPCPTPPASRRRLLLSPGRAAWLAGVLVAAGVGAPAPNAAWAKAKRSAKNTPAAESAAAPDPGSTTAPTEPAAGAAAADPATSPPAAGTPAAAGGDAAGGSQFGPAAAGTGTVTVEGDGMQIYFNGRSFGAAPVTIRNVPKGDYVVEGTAPNGTHVSRPVTVDENAESVVDLQAPLINAPTAAPVVDGRSGRLPLASKVLLGVSGGALATGIVFGLLSWKTHNEYESAPADRATLAALERTGQRDAVIANIGFITCGVSLVAAGVIALPRLFKSEQPAPAAAPATTTVAFTASTTRSSVIAGVSMQF